MDPVDFENDGDVQMFLDTLRMIYASCADRMMVNEEDAQLHMRNTMGDNMHSGGGMM